MNNQELLKLCQEQIGDDYLELLQIASVINVLCEELDNEKVSQKVEELIDFIKEEAKVILERKDAEAKTTEADAS